MNTQPTGPTNRDIDQLFTGARLSAYLSGTCPDLRIDSYTILGCGKNLDGFLYLDIYHAIADDTCLVGMEFLISPTMDILKHVSYAGGYRPPAKAAITPRDIFDGVLKPCRTQYLSAGKSYHELSLHGYRYRYTYETTPTDDHEVISLWVDNSWEVIHEVRFHTHKT